MYQKLLFLFVSFLLTTVQLSAQEKWIRTLPSVSLPGTFYGTGGNNVGDSYLLNNGNYLIQYNNEYFFEVDTEGFVTNEHYFEDYAFVKLEQNTDGSFRAIGGKGLNPNNFSPRYFEFSENFDIETEEVLGIDSTLISNMPFSIRAISSAIFHENGDFSLIVRSTFPGGLQNLIRLDSDYNKILEVENIFSASINPLMKEDNDGNYIVAGLPGAFTNVLKYTPEWDLIWNTSTSSSLITDFTVLSDGQIVVFKLDAPLSVIDNQGEISTINTGIYSSDSYGYELPNGNILLTGSSVDSTLLSFGTCIREITLAGEELWKNYYYFDRYEGGRKLLPLADGSFLIFATSYLSSEPDLKIIKTDEQGKLFDNQIYASAKVDEDADCETGNNAPAFPNLLITAEGNEQYAGVSYNEGAFVLMLPNGDYTLHAETPSPFWDICENDYEIEVTDDANISRLFELNANEACPFPIINMATPGLLRCFNNNYYLRIYNEGTTPLIDATLEITIDDFFELDTVYAVDSYTFTGNLITIPLPEIAPFEHDYIRLFGRISCDSDLGQNHCFSANITTAEGCLQSYLPISFENCEANVGSFDPNDITAYTDGLPEFNDYFEGQQLDYRIRFQNTGTATAFTVAIETEIDDLLDLSTLKITGSSHDYVTKVNGRHLLFEFNDINLPDSTSNLEESMGFISFNIQPFPEAAIGSFIDMQSDIFFDFNEPITTNLSSLVVVEPNASANVLSEETIQLFPNPFSESFIFKNANNQSGTLYLWNALGQLKQVIPIDKNQQNIDCSNLNSGVYFYNFFEKGRSKGSGTILKN